MATDKAQDPWHGAALAEMLTSGKLEMKPSEGSCSALPINPHVPAHPNGIGRAARLNNPRLRPHCSSAQPILAPNTAVLRSSARSRAGARPRRRSSPQRSAPLLQVRLEVQAGRAAGLPPERRIVSVMGSDSRARNLLCYSSRWLCGEKAAFPSPG